MIVEPARDLTFSGQNGGPVLKSALSSVAEKVL